MRNSKNPLSSLLKEDKERYDAIMRLMPAKIGVVATRFFKENFKRQGFLDSSVQKWDVRKKTDAGRSILVKSRVLRRSIRTITTTKNTVTVGVVGSRKTEKYAGVHNFGLKAGRPSPGSFNMPLRKFIGKSKTLDSIIVKLLEKSMKK
jgi:phage gpG-like protein